MGFFSNLFTGGEGFAAANNALLAEYMISQLPQESKRKIANKVIEMAFGAGFRGQRSDFVAFFCGAERIPQLNLIGFAIMRLEMPIGLPNEDWMPVKNPFVVSVSQNKIDSRRLALQREHGLNLNIGIDSIDLWEWV